MEQIKSNTKTKKKWKFLKWFIVLISIPLIIIAIHFSFYFSTKSIVKSNQSINAKATEYFIHANVISTLWVNLIHNYLFIDYDSPIMKPLLYMTDYYFHKGEELVKSNSAEDAVWWFLTYAYIYSLNTSDRKDNSMDIYLLPKNEEMKLRYKLTDYIIKIGNYGVKGIEFGKYESSAMHTMFATHFSKIDIDKHYIGITKQDRVNNYWKDKILYDSRVKSYEAYKKFVKQDKYKDGWELYSLSNLNSRLWFLIVKDIEDAKVMNNCENKYLKDYFRNLNDLVFFANMNNNSIPNMKIKQDLLRLKRTNGLVINILQTSCPKYKTIAIQIKEQLKQMEGKENGKYRNSTTRSD